jgi:hypothetical protein
VKCLVPNFLSASIYFAIYLALVVVGGCDSKSARDGKASDTRTSSTSPIEQAPRGVPGSQPETFGALVVDVDRVVLAERTILALDDAGMPTGDEAHPAAYETTDSEWIASFIASVGKGTQRSLIERPCEPWADLTLYTRGEAIASLAVDCSKERAFSTFGIRGKPEAFVGAAPQSLKTLFESLQEG